MDSERHEWIEFVGGPRGGDMLKWTPCTFFYIADGDMNHWYQRVIDKETGKHVLAYVGERIEDDGPPPWP